MKHIQPFEAKDDQGNVYTLHVNQKMIDVGTRKNPNAVAPVQKQIQTDDGKTVNHTNKQGVYEIAISGIILRSDDPNAP